MVENLVTLRTIEEMKALETLLDSMEFIAYDTETTGLDWDARVIGFSICGDLTEAYYVILSYWDKDKKQLVELETQTYAAEFIAKLVGRKLIMHYAVFDARVTQVNFGVQLMPSVHTDTMILAHLLNEKRHCGLKELAVTFYGEDSKKEQEEMKASVTKNGGQLTKACYELYKADADLLALYGAKDTLLTLKIFYTMVPTLYEENLDKFFYDEESMPLLRGPTYQLNTSGLRIDPDRLRVVKNELQAEMQSARSFIYTEIADYVKEVYPGTSKKTSFNIGAPKQLSWLIFEKLHNEFSLLTDSGKAVCKFLGLRLPYNKSAKFEFINLCRQSQGRVYCPAARNPKTGKMAKDKKIGPYWHYLKCGKATLEKLADKYQWVERLLEYKKSDKLLGTYIEGIEERMRYNIIRPDFKQHGTTSGRYSCKSPNFQNLPRKDKRVKSCIIARPNKVFVGADYAQLEPRVFAFLSGDETLQRGFALGEDFYSVVGAPIFGKEQYSKFKEDPNSFATLFPDLRDKSKIIALAIPYGRIAMQLASALGCSINEAQDIINRYLEEYFKVHEFMLGQHEQAKTKGIVYSYFGRPRRIPEAKLIGSLYGKNTAHAQLPYEARNLLNLAMNHPIQSTGASIMNRAAIAFCEKTKHIPGVIVVSQVHDELIAECFEKDKEEVKRILKECMETTTILPGVALIAEPKIAINLADLK